MQAAQHMALRVRIIFFGKLGGHAVGGKQVGAESLDKTAPYIAADLGDQVQTAGYGSGQDAHSESFQVGAKRSLSSTVGTEITWSAPRAAMWRASSKACRRSQQNAMLRARWP